MVHIKYICDDADHATEMVCYANENNQIFIEIKDPNGNPFHESQFIVLDKNTAKKLAKDLRREISFLKD